MPPHMTRAAAAAKQRKPEFDERTPVEVIAERGVAKFKRFGWRTVLRGLPEFSDLAKYEGFEVREMEAMDDGTYAVEVDDGMTVRLPARFFCSETIGTTRRNSVTQELFSQIQTASKDPEASSMNVVLTGLRKFLMKQVEKIIRGRTHCTEPEAMRILFKEFDLDHGGTVDKSEFLVGLARLGFSLLPDDLNVLWPMILPDTEEIDIKVLFNFLLQPRRRGSVTMREHQHVKKMYRNALKLRKLISNYVKSHETTAEELFRQWDKDASEELDIEEVMSGMKEMNIGMPEKDVQVLWPMLTEQTSGSLAINCKNWVRLIEDEDSAREFLLTKFQGKSVLTAISSEDLANKLEERKEQEKLKWMRKKAQAKRDGSPVASNNGSSRSPVSSPQFMPAQRGGWMAHGDRSSSRGRGRQRGGLLWGFCY